MKDYRISYIFSHTQKELSITQAEQVLQVSSNEFIQIIERFNQVSSQLFGCKLSTKDGLLQVPNELTKKWVDVLFKKKREEVIFLEEERQSMIFLLTFAQLEELSVFHFQEFLLVSKNTILKDVKKLRKLLATQGITLEYTRKKGFHLQGKERMIRAIAFSLFGRLLTSENGDRLLYEGLLSKSPTLYSEVRTKFSQTIETFDFLFVPSRLDEMIYFVSYLICRAEKYEISFSLAEKKLLAPLLAHEASQNFLEDFSSIKNPKMEALYFTITFMAVLQGQLRDSSLEFLFECASEIIREIERLAAIEFKNYQKLLLDLFYHLVPAYFRILFDFRLSNVLIEEIKLQYKEMFELTEAALLPLKRLLQRPIPEEEIGYFTILFGGEIRNQKEKKKTIQVKALILCPSGISSSLIMKSELQELFPQLDFSETSSLERYNNQNFEENYDVIFSSVPIKTKKKIYVINPIMTQLEKNILIQQVQEDFLLSKVWIPSVDEILDILLPHIELKKGMTKEKLYKVIQRKMNKELKRREDERPMLSELLTPDMIQLSEKKMRWEEAIELAAEPLKNTQKIEPSYIDAMINKVKDYGPFIHIGKGVALPHARPEDGVNELGMSLLKVKEPVLLSDNEEHPIQIFICLAAIDNEMHLKALASLTRILSNKEKLDTLLTANTKEDILEIMMKGEKE